MEAISNFWLGSYVYVFCLCSEVTQLKELTSSGNSAVICICIKYILGAHLMLENASPPKPLPQDQRSNNKNVCR